jgi:tRNA(Ile)-lysidine synthase
VKNDNLETSYLVTTSDIEQESFKSAVNLGFETLHEIPSMFANPANTAFIDFEKLNFPLLIRKWNRGDFFYPMGMTQRKKLSDFFTDQKFSAIEKEKTWLLCSNKDIVRS